VVVELLQSPQWLPDFFLIMPDFVSLLSSEYHLGLINWLSLTLGGVFSFSSPAAVEKFHDCRRGHSKLVILISGQIRKIVALGVRETAGSIPKVALIQAEH
jgi:hypothetical protein